MRTVFTRYLLLPTVAMLTFAAGAAGQDKPFGLLNSFEVRQLVDRAEPGDHARLGAHFAALGVRYTAEAKRHTSMAQNYIGNPSRNLGTGMSAHCKQLANLNTQSATTVRELAAYHEKLSSGGMATLPRDGAKFHGGAGAPEPTDNELNALAAKASLPAEHRALEEYFRTLAERYDAMRSNTPHLPEDCERLAPNTRRRSTVDLPTSRVRPPRRPSRLPTCTGSWQHSAASRPAIRAGQPGSDCLLDLGD
jgi:hypothetical protein